jgi:acylpyruvate hydrolase
MKFISFRLDTLDGIALQDKDGLTGLTTADKDYPGDLSSLVAGGIDRLKAAAAVLRNGRKIDAARIEYRPLLSHASKILCFGLNYRDHAAESGMAVPDYPAIFARFPSSLIGHGAPIVRPHLSEQLDYEGELVTVIGKRGRNIPRESALDHVLGYSIFNDASIRDFQLKAPQWTVGKNFDNTGAFGPVLVTADELPSGCRGLRLSTRLNGTVVQSAPIDDMVFDIATQISIVSQTMTLEPGDVIVTGTPSGVGAARKPPLWMKPGDTCEVEIEGIGILSNPVIAEAA